jgi:LPXTG-motif cell wall-anchored protein
VSIIAWLVVGAIAGYVANMVLGTRNGLIMTVLFGIVGAIVGGAAWSYIQNRTLDFNAMLTGIDIPSILAAIVGAVVLGAIGGWWGKRRSPA